KLSGKTGRRPYNDQLSRYSTVGAADALRELVCDAQCSHILISYNDEGRLSRKQIMEILAQRGTPIVYEFDAKRYSSQSSKQLQQEGQSRKKQVTELLFHVEVTK